MRLRSKIKGTLCGEGRPGVTGESCGENAENAGPSCGVFALTPFITILDHNFRISHIRSQTMGLVDVKNIGSPTLHMRCISN